MNSLRNCVQLIGHLGREPELKTFDSGKKKMTTSIATNEFYTKDGEKVQETQWHNLTAWGKLAENMERVLSKGNEVAVKGKLTNRSFENKEGNTQYFTEVIVNEFVKITKKEDLPF